VRLWVEVLSGGRGWRIRLYADECKKDGPDDFDHQVQVHRGPIVASIRPHGLACGVTDIRNDTRVANHVREQQRMHARGRLQ
jgi:hypothetical protein